MTHRVLPPSVLLDILTHYWGLAMVPDRKPFYLHFDAETIPDAPPARPRTQAPALRGTLLYSLLAFLTVGSARCGDSARPERDSASRETRATSDSNDESQYGEGRGEGVTHPPQARGPATEQGRDPDSPPDAPSAADGEDAGNTFSSEMLAAWLEGIRHCREECGGGRLDHRECSALRESTLEGWQDRRLAYLNDAGIEMARSLFVETAPNVLALREVDRLFRASAQGAIAIVSDYHQAMINLQPFRARRALQRMSDLQRSLSTHARNLGLSLREHPTVTAYMNAMQPEDEALWRGGDAAVLYEAYQRIAPWASCADREGTNMPGLRRLVATHGQGSEILTMTANDLAALEVTICELGDLPLTRGVRDDPRDEPFADARFGIAILRHTISLSRTPVIAPADLDVTIFRETIDARRVFDDALSLAREQKHQREMAESCRRHAADMERRRQALAAKRARRERALTG